MSQEPRPEASRIRKEWTRRLAPDRSQTIRRATQIAFLLLNIWIGVEFYHFVRQFEPGGTFRGLTRPPGVEGWLPIAGMMNTWYFLQTGEMPRVHPAAMVLLLTFFALSFLFRKAFCGWLCPVGTLSEQLWKIGRSTFRRVFFPPRWLDVALRSLKYILFGLFAWAVFSMSAAALSQFLESPYGLIADVKMLGFFRYLGPTAAVVLGLLIFGSFFIPNIWCRYLCPYGALMGIASLVSPARIRRSPEACIDCAKCAKACPANLPVDQLVQIRSAECLGCMECVAVCPAENALEMGVGFATGIPAKTPKRRLYWQLPPRTIAVALAVLFVAAVAAARLTGHWESDIPHYVYQHLVPRAHEFAHP